MIYGDFLRDYPAAERELNRSLKLNPAFTPAWLNLGNLCEDLGRWEDAIAAYVRILSFDPQHPLALSRFANLQPRGATDPALVARYEALGKLPDNSFGKALWRFNKDNGYTFPGDPKALNAGFATPHDSTHVISGYDTTFRGEILVSTFTAGMHPINPMAGHILPVIFNGHLGVKFNDVATPAHGGLDPDEFWHAWARGQEMTTDLFDPGWDVWQWVEHDLETLRRDWNVT